MGVDCASFVAYGDFLNDIEILEECPDDNIKLFFLNEDGELCYDSDVADSRDFTIILEPYSNDWFFIGVSFLGETPEDTIENLKNVNNRWEELIKELKEVIPEEETYLFEKINKLKPEIINYSYYS